jgi:hypothetical protein
MPPKILSFVAHKLATRTHIYGVSGHTGAPSSMACMKCKGIVRMLNLFQACLLHLVKGSTSSFTIALHCFVKANISSFTLALHCAF